ncbi:hypothetical protein [Mesorhizobium sp. YM1C-6-2]|uniref:hypothetical protein n=1 Tax=Mesorhizobium sp. YM1C-6-2 TaxID=1827501 RepID=UPI000EF1E988|nr:hypothetical protein [Mesorhizobium sp. YM1C-6-2]RLP21985.1 hypothetical protein D8676_26490 [Mesorhizobium sp. YM1C-6-2]
MTNFDRCLAAASALSRHLEGRGTTIDELSDAFLAEAIGASNAARGRLATAERLRFLADYLEASDVD